MTVGQDAQTKQDIEALDAEMAVLTEKQKAVEQRARELMAAEDHKAGVYYAQEIFAAKQEKLTLETQLEIARRRRNRLLAG